MPIHTIPERFRADIHTAIRILKSYGALTMDLESPFDLVDLDNDAAFVQSLRRGGRLERVA